MIPALVIKNLHKTYDNGHVALKGISLKVEQGDFLALLGPNGAGKSTTIGIITSLVNKTSGEVEVFGHNLDKEPAAAKRHVGLVPQEFNFNQFEQVFHTVVQQAGFYGIPRNIAEAQAEKYLKQLRLWEKRHSITRELSGGMKRRLMIARALVHEPELLILDEPTAGVDIEIRRSMWEFLTEINRAGKTIILTTHYLEEAEQLCEDVTIIDHGAIIESANIKQLLAQADRQTLILSTEQTIDQPPIIEGLEITTLDKHTLEVSFNNTMGLSNVINELSKHHINISSLRNKTNRLEELFINLTTTS